MDDAELRPEEPFTLIEDYDFLNVFYRFKTAQARLNKGENVVNRLVAAIDKIIDEAPYLGKPLPPRTTVPTSTTTEINNDLHASSSSSGISSSPVSAIEERCSSSSSSSTKLEIVDDEYQESSTDDEISSISCQHNQHEPDTEQYPQQLGDVVILGPSGTEVDVKSYTSIIWSSPAAATRQLLGFVFSSDVLATHTLTGKPSPAFYGRERPAKMQLDTIRTGDIIHCVRSKFNCCEREIRAAITTKCSDTSKKYKRRSQKQMEKK